MFTFPMTLFGVSGPYYTYNGKAAVQSSASSFSFASQALGDAASNRYIVAVVEVFTSGTNFTISSLTVAGVSASQVVTRDDSGGAQKVRTEMWIAAVPTGASGNIDVTFAGSVTKCMVANYALYNLSSSTAAHTASDGGGSGDTSASVSIDVPASGILLASGAYVNSADTQTLSGVTEDDSEINATVIHWHWGSHRAGAAETGTSVTYSGTSAAGSARSLVAASWS